MKNLLLIVSSLFIFTAALAAQSTPDFQTVKTERGMMVLNNGKSQPFSFLVAGGNPRDEQDTDGSLFIQTDSNGVLVYFTKTALFLSVKSTEKDTLAAHRNLYILNMEKTVGAKINIDKEGSESISVHDLRGGKDEFARLESTFWSYPATNPEIPNRLYFQNVVIGDQTLLLGMVFRKTTSVEKIQGLVKTILESITLLPIPKPAAVVKKKPIKKKTKKN